MDLGDWHYLNWTIACQERAQAAKRGIRWMIRRWFLCQHDWEPVYHSYQCRKCGGWNYD